MLSAFSVPLLISFIFIIGLCVGSFLNVLIDRLPNEEGIGGRSHCDHCKRTLTFFDLIPVFSWILLGGKCRTCKKRVSIQYPFIEIVTGVVFVLTWMYFDPYWFSIPNMIGYFVLVSSCIVIVGADYKYHIIPDSATVAFTIGSFLISRGGPIASQLSGGVVLFMVLFAIFALTKGKMMGFGDVKLAFGMGVLFGIVNGLLALYLSFVVGGIVSVFLLLRGKSGLKDKIAFGPFMIMGTILMLVYSRQVHEIIGKMF